MEKEVSDENGNDYAYCVFKHGGAMEMIMPLVSLLLRIPMCWTLNCFAFCQKKCQECRSIYLLRRSIGPSAKNIMHIVMRL